MGPTGPTGTQGIQGTAGAQGPQGTAGTNGTNGATGPQGPQGTAGITGVTGPTGSIGPTGPTGSGGGGGLGGILVTDYTNSTNSFTDVTGISFAVAANSTYVVTGDLIFKPHNGDIVFQFTGPASPTSVYAQFWDITGGGGGTAFDVGVHTVTAFSSTIASFSFGGQSGNKGWAPFRIKIVNGVNAGTVQLQAKAGTNTELNTVYASTNIVVIQIG